MGPPFTFETAQGRLRLNRVSTVDGERPGGRREISHLAVFAWLWLVAGADLLWENSTADWLVAGADLVWENSIAGWLANKPSEHSKY